MKLIKFSAMETNLEFGNYSALENLTAELNREKKKANVLQYIVIGLCVFGLGFMGLHLIHELQKNAKKDSIKNGEVQWT